MPVTATPSCFIGSFSTRRISTRRISIRRILIITLALSPNPNHIHNRIEIRRVEIRRNVSCSRFGELKGHRFIVFTVSHCVHIFHGIPVQRLVNVV